MKEQMDALSSTCPLMEEEKAGDEGLRERIAQITAHRACCGSEHDVSNGKIHGCCVVCGVPWPCEYAGTPSRHPAPSRTEELVNLCRREIKLAREQGNGSSFQDGRIYAFEEILADYEKGAK